MDCTQKDLIESPTNRDIYLIPMSGSDTAERITSDPGNETDPVWRPAP
jgi:Tol biopolymer transport system component